MKLVTLGTVTAALETLVTVTFALELLGNVKVANETFEAVTTGTAAQTVTMILETLAWLRAVVRRAPELLIAELEILLPVMVVRLAPLTVIHRKPRVVTVVFDTLRPVIVLEMMGSSRMVRETHR